jgi:hypothetical protein
MMPTRAVCFRITEAIGQHPASSLEFAHTGTPPTYMLQVQKHLSGKTYW